MFREYFELYDLMEDNATSVSIGCLQLVIFDPQATLIPRLFKKYTVEERNSSYKSMINYL